MPFKHLSFSTDTPLHIATEETVVCRPQTQLQLLRSGCKADIFYPNCRPAVLNAPIFHTGRDSIFYLKLEGRTEENLGRGWGEFWCQSLPLLRVKCILSTA